MSSRHDLPLKDVKMCVDVVGCGQMGSGIAQLAATNGCEVWLHDSDSVALSKARESISSRIQNLVIKGHLTKDKGAEAIRNLRCTSNLEDFRSADMVIEAIVESEDVKKKLFVQSDNIVKSSSILASNTSSISITRLASVTNRPSQIWKEDCVFSGFLGVHRKLDSDADDKRSISCAVHWCGNQGGH